MRAFKGHREFLGHGGGALDVIVRNLCLAFFVEKPEHPERAAFAVEQGHAQELFDPVGGDQVPAFFVAGFLANVFGDQGQLAVDHLPDARGHDVLVGLRECPVDAAPASTAVAAFGHGDKCPLESQELGGPHHILAEKTVELQRSSDLGRDAEQLIEMLLLSRREAGQFRVVDGHAGEAAQHVKSRDFNRSKRSAPQHQQSELRLRGEQRLGQPAPRRFRFGLKGKAEVDELLFLKRLGREGARLRNQRGLARSPGGFSGDVVEKKSFAVALENPRNRRQQRAMGDVGDVVAHFARIGPHTGQLGAGFQHLLHAHRIAIGRARSALSGFSARLHQFNW